MTEYSQNYIPKIKNRQYCESLEETVKQDNEYIDSINYLYQTAKSVLSESKFDSLQEYDEGENCKSVLPKVQAHIKKIEEEIAKSKPDVFEGDFNKLVFKDKSKLDKQNPENPIKVCFKFIENPEFTVNYRGKIKSNIEAYFNSSKIRFTCEKDSHDFINNIDPSFSKYRYVKKIREDCYSSVTILCSECSNEMYVFSDCYINYPINIKDVAKFGGTCITITDEGSSFNKYKLIRKLDKVLHKNEIEKTEALFKEKYPDQKSEEIIPFLLLQSLMTANAGLFHYTVSNFRLLIDENCEILIPRFISNDNKRCRASLMLLYDKGLLPLFLSKSEDDVDEDQEEDVVVSTEDFHFVNEEKINQTLIDASKFYYELCDKSKIEVDGTEYLIEFDKVPYYQLALYCYCYIDENVFREDKNLFTIYENYLEELFKNVDVNATLETNSKIFRLLIDHALSIGMPEILKFAEKKDIGFHSKRECDLDELVFFTFGFIITFTQVEIDNKNFKGQLDVFKFLLDTCGDEIFKKLSKDSNGKKKEYFKSRFLKWRDLFTEIYLNFHNTENKGALYEDEFRKKKRILENIKKEIETGISDQYIEKLSHLHE